MTNRRIFISARFRILAWIFLVVLFATALIVLATQRVLVSSVDESAAIKLSHEASQFHSFVASGDPETGEEFSSLEELFSSHLSRQLPEQSETFFALIGGEAFARSADSPPVRLDEEEALLALIADVTDPVAFREDTAAGPAEIAVIPVREADGLQGSLVVVQFLGPALADVNRSVKILAIVSLIALGLAAGIGWIVAGRVLRPIRTLKETAESITESDLSRRIAVTGSDDVARLAATFNTMLDRLEVAFSGQRQFLDDVGHELRTPITVVRGHLELMGDDPAERRETLRLVHDELLRMARMVDDLTLLARSERPDFLQTGNVHLADLVMDALTHGSKLGERRYAIDQLPENVVIADEQRLLQALMQLAANAVKHTRKSDTISFGGAVENGLVRLWVSDTGMGIAVADQSKLFDRFSRGNAQPSSKNGVDLGLGIGLEIVARIAEAHGGTVELRSNVGEGATFILSFPEVFPEEPQ